MLHLLNKKRAVARWLQILCLTALAALPQTAKADITADRLTGNMPAFKVITSTNTNTISLDNPYIVLSMDLINGDRSQAWKDFEILVTGPNGKLVSVASMSGMGYAPATRHTLMASTLFYPNTQDAASITGNTSWTSNRPKIGQYSTKDYMEYFFYGMQDIQYSAGAATGSGFAQYNVKIALLPVLFYYDRPGAGDANNETVTIKIEGTSINYNNEETAEIHKVTVKLDIEEPQLKFARANGSVTCETDLFNNDDYGYYVDLYGRDPIEREVTEMDFFLEYNDDGGLDSKPDETLLPISTSEVLSTSFTSQVFVFNGMTIDNRKSLTLHPVTRFSRKSQDALSVNGLNTGNNFLQYFLCSRDAVTLPGFAYPENVSAACTDSYNKKITVTWEANGIGDYSKDGKWYVYRQEADDPTADIVCLGSTSSYSKMEFVDENKDGHLEYGQTYTYTVCFVPTGWDSESYKGIDGLYAQQDIELERTFSFGSAEGDEPQLYTTTERNKNELVLHWTHTAIGDASSKTYKLYVDRTTTPDEATSWEEQASFDINSSNTTTGTYKDTKGLELYETYYYRLRINVQGSDYVSSVFSGQLEGGSEITRVTASRGTYTSVVKLQWEVKQVGSSKSYFVLSRRPLGSTDDEDYADIYTTSGTDDIYSYDDGTARSGSYYEYRVRIYALHKGEQKGAMSMSTDGYCVQTGVLSGRIYYGTGTAVEGVKVLLEPNDGDGETLNRFRSIDLSADDASIVYAPGYNKMNNLLGNDFSMQLYVNPPADGGEQSLVVVPEALNITLKPVTVDDEEKYEVCYRTDLTADATGLGVYVKADEWSHLTLSYRRSARELTAYVVACKSGTTEPELRRAPEPMRNVTVTVTRSNNRSTDGATALILGEPCGSVAQYRGLVDEFRLWTKALTQSDVEKNYYRTLSGAESRLAIYWPMDEGMQNQVVAYDLSQTNDAANECHATVTHATSSENVPGEDMLSLCTITDSEGNYVLRGVPFSGNGTNYVVTPLFGIHEFSPSSASCYLSGQSTVHSGIDFTDASSFPVTGTVLYEGTTIPVEGAFIYVDGTIAARDGEAVATNAQGEYTVDVPIGDHFISVKSNGHEFLNGGRYPADPDGVGARHTFESAISNINFTDQTKVAVGGRVAGGNVENDKPIGVGAGKANIGKAKIELSFVGSDRYYINAKLVTTGLSQSYDINDQTLTYEEASDSINSQAYVKGGKNVITIETDPVTGEWSAKVPPLKYEAQSITIPTQPDIDFSQKLFVLDATNPSVVMTDSIESDQEGLDGYARFKHVAVARVAYKSPSFLDVVENADGSFGASVREVTDDNGTKEELKLYTVQEDGTIDYTFGAPIYFQENSYAFDLFAYENYINNDGAEPVYDKVPLGNTEVTIKNEFAATTSVLLEDGELYEVENETFELDSLGRAKYIFTAGFPNIVEPYTRTLNISYDVDGTKMSWEQNGHFQAIVLGGLPKGNNFVTQGPDYVLMVLRDPPGTGSNITWTKGTSITSTTERTFSRHSNTETTETLMLGFETQTGVGGPVILIQDAKSKASIEAGFSINYSEDHGTASSSTVTTTRDISTSDAPDYVGASGDLFIGSSRNILLGAVNNVNIYKSPVDGSYSLDCKEAMSMGEEFGTAFVHTAYYVENTLIPEFKSLRAQCLTFIGEDGDVRSVAQPKGDKPIYVTTISPDDERFGSRNSDKDIWGDKAVEFEEQEMGDGYIIGPSYTIVMPEDPDISFSDTISFFNNQIENWEKTLRNNEEAKVKAIESRNQYLKKNYSFDSGAIITETYEYYSDSTSSEAKTYEYNWHAGAETGFQFCGTGLGLKVSEDAGMSYFNQTTSTTASTEAFSYTLAEEGNTDYISVDVLNAPDGFAPIFYTRAGATSGPYEDEVVTKYYKPGTVIQQKTLQVEKPELEILDPIITGVPAGKDAVFRIVMRNNSETKENIYYGIRVEAASNPDGAQIFMDGKNITEGAQVLVMGGESVTKTLQLRQTNQDILEYNDIVLHMYAVSQPDDIFSEKSLNVSFQPSCTDIELTASTSLVNTDTESPMILSMSGYDYNQSSFAEIRLQYKGENDANYKNLQVYVKDQARVDADPNLKLFTALTGTNKLTYSLDLRESDYTDQAYLFRAVTVGYRGGDEVTSQSEEVRIVRDMSRPQLIANPTPTSGILGAGDNITLTFNEDIASNVLTKTNNFIVTGTMNEGEVAHDVALDLTSAGVARTTATIDLAGRSFAADFWLNYSADGTVLQHGTSGNSFTAAIRDGKLVLAIGEEEVVSTETLPKNKWLFVALSYDCSGDEPLVSASYAQETDIVSLISGVALPAYNAAGPLTLGGNGLVARMQEVSLWGNARSISDALTERNKTKDPYTSGLIGYWQLNEGHGTVATDAARRRDLTLPAQNAWFINSGTNYTVKLDGTHAVEAPITTTATADDSYLVELWFNATGKTSGNQTIVSFGKYADISLNAQGRAVVTIDGTSTTASTTDYADGQWHHLAMNVLKGSNGSATLYMDGAAVRQFTAASMPSLSRAAHLVLGARELSDDSFDQFLTGYADELRAWNGRRTAETIKTTMYQRVADDAEGLEGYYPMESRALDSYGQVVTESCATEMKAGGKSGLALFTNGGTVQFATEAPSLTTAPAVENVQFEYVASERQITINLSEQASKIENCNVNLTVKNVKDLNGNPSQPITWTIFVKQNQLQWVENEMNVETVNGQAETFTAEVENMGATADSWTLTGVPEWLTVNTMSGTLAPLASQKLRFTVNGSTAVGNYEATLYLTGSQNIKSPLTISLKVKGDEPDWNPVPDEETMAIVGQLKVDDIISSNPDDMIAAFRGQECVGVARPIYISRYDAYFINMVVYGNSDTEGAKLNYKYYDASTGTVYPSVAASKDGVFTFHASTWVGTFTDWVVFSPENKIEQDLSLKRSGWKWFSMYVAPDDNTIGSIFADAEGSVVTLKDAENTALYAEDAWKGSLTTLGMTTMYKLQASEAYDETTIGVPANPASVDIQLSANGWSWIGYPVSATNSVTAAFADAEPEEGDIIMGQSAFAMFTDGDWLGSLTSMIPGDGYKYYSNGSEAKTFHFQKPAGNNASRVNAMRQNNGTLHITSENNMAVVAKVMKGGNVVDDAIISVYDGDQLCGYSAGQTADGIHFLTIGDMGTSGIMNLVVETNGETYLLNGQMRFEADAVTGSVKKPHVINLDAATAIDAYTVARSIERIEMYDVNGSLIKVENHPDSLLRAPEAGNGQVLMQRVIYTDGTVSVLKTINR